ncbi:SIR2-domain-containing protein [Flagelloscypha sp. PMI_526]|nr:SIR2-domain-containing protein [Flagelloscypha sp. PMI_526]
MARVLQQLQCFLAYADEIELDNDTVQDLLEIDVEEDDDAIAEDLAIERVVDMTSLYSTLEGDKQPWSKQDIRYMLIHLKQKGMNSFIQEYVKIREIPIPKLLLAFGIDLAPALHQKRMDTHLYFLKVALSRELQRRERLGQYSTIEDAINLINNSQKIIILTGAGISVSCGIPDFRSQNGIYASLSQNEDYEFDIEFFRAAPKGKNYTQNIDTLEHAAGVRRVLNCHGSFATARCLQCRRQVPGSDIEGSIMSQQVPLCTVCPQQPPLPIKPRRKGKRAEDDDDDDEPDLPEFPPSIMKPDITFFGEKLDDAFDKAFAEDREQADLLLIIGTSLKVAPVADLPVYLPHSIPQILINKTPVKHINPDLILLGNADDIVGHLCHRLSWELPSSPSKPDSISPVASQAPEFQQPDRVGDSHIWLFNGAEGGQWLRKIQRQMGLSRETNESEGEEQDGGDKATKRAKLE